MYAETMWEKYSKMMRRREVVGVSCVHGVVKKASCRDRSEGPVDKGPLMTDFGVR